MSNVGIDPRQSLPLYSIESLHLIAQRLGLPSSRQGPVARLVEDICRVLSRHEYVEQLLANTTPRQREVLAYFYRKGTDATLWALYSVLLAAGARPEEARRELTGLLETALVLPVPGQYFFKLTTDLERIIMYHVPAGPLKLLQRFREAHLQPALPPVDADPPAHADSGGLVELRRDLYLLLRFVQQYGLRVTQKGTFHKTDLKKLAAALQNQPAPAGVKRTGSTARAPANSPGELEPRQAFALALAEQARLVQREGDVLRASSDALQVLALPEHEQVKRFVEAWPNTTWSELFAVPTLAFDRADDPLHAGRALMAARRLLLAQLEPAREWTDPLALAARLRRLEPEFLVRRPTVHRQYLAYAMYGLTVQQKGQPQARYQGLREKGAPATRQLDIERDWDKVEGAYVRYVIAGPLYWMGVVELGRDDQGQLVSFRLTPAGRYAILGDALPEQMVRPEGAAATPKLVVQPSFEVVVLDTLRHIDLVSQLDVFADQRSLDRAAVYHLSRHSVVRGLEAGMRAVDIITFLELHAHTSLPQNVRASIEDWERQFERIQVKKGACLLEVDEPGQLDWLMAEPRAASLLVSRLSPTLALVRGDGLRELRRILQQRRLHVEEYNFARPVRRAVGFLPPATLRVPRAAHSPYIEYLLGSFADVSDALAEELHYTISQQSVQRARQRDLPWERIEQVLFELCGDAVPYDLRLTIRGWWGAYRPVGVDRVVALETPPNLTWRELMYVEAIAPLISQVLSPTVALVRERVYPALARELGKRGIELQEREVKGLGALGPFPLYSTLPVPVQRPQPGGRRLTAADLEEGATLNRLLASLLDSPGHRNGDDLSLQWPGYDNSIEALEDLLEEAVEEGDAVRLVYRDPQRGRVEAIVEPLEVAYGRGKSRLRAYNASLDRELFIPVEQIERAEIIPEGEER
jgi:hypothetical protein